MFVSTFYSYKGGVGRTSALVNVAHRLVSHGKRVFILDFDLEAPGIDSYKLLDAGNTPGLVEYISAFTATGKVPDLKDFVLDFGLPDTSGKLFLMRGGRKDDSYKSALAHLNWKILYRQKKGFFLIENLKAAIDKIFQPDYLLVDARTGLTDVSGICTLQLPHLVVLLFSLNEQNIVGVNEILQSVKSNKINREIDTLLVASPVPDTPEWLELRSSRFDFARKVMGSPVDVVVPYDAFLAFGECIIDGQHRGQTKSNLSKAYDLLTEKIIAANRSDIVTLLGKARKLVEEGQHDIAESHYRGIVDAMPNSVDAWVEFGRFERLRGRLQRACEHFAQAYALEPKDSEILAQLASTYAIVDREMCKRYYREFLQTDHTAIRIQRVSSALLHAGLSELAVEGFVRVTELDAKNIQGHISVGEARMHLGHYRQSIDAYRQALELDPNSLVCTFNVGLAYQRLEDSRAVEYYRKAIDIFEQTKRPTQKAELANTYEAISRAYFAVGKGERAIQLLEEAIDIAKGLPNTRIFSSARYEYISQAKFVAEVSSRLQVARRKFGAADSVMVKSEKPLPN